MAGGNGCFQMAEAQMICSETEWEEKKKNWVEHLLWVKLCAHAKLCSAADEEL